MLTIFLYQILQPQLNSLITFWLILILTVFKFYKTAHIKPLYAFNLTRCHFSATKNCFVMATICILLEKECIDTVNYSSSFSSIRSTWESKLFLFRCNWLNCNMKKYPGYLISSHCGDFVFNNLLNRIMYSVVTKIIWYSQEQNNIMKWKAN